MLSVDVTRCVAHNEKPPSMGMLSGLCLTKRALGVCMKGSEHPQHMQASGSGQGGFAP